MENTIEIPEGYEARIKGNKVIEQNLANSGKTRNVEPKFRVGDWIISDEAHEDYRICKITNVENGNYTIESIYGCKGYNTFETFENSYHRWTIQDAKDGDVLATPNQNIFIFKEINDNTVYDYCGLYFNKILKEPSTVNGICAKELPKDYVPATKEQRDLLFQKMKEDVEKKELRKIEPKPTIKDELFDRRYAQHLVENQRQKSMIQWKGDNLKEVIDFTGKDRNFDKWFKSFEEYEQYVQKHNGIFKLFNTDGSHYEVPVGAWIVKTPDGYNVASKAIFKQNPTWSKEDEEMLRRCISATFDHGYLKECDWLKSFKERTTWKPSDEQMEVLKEACDINTGSQMG